MSKSQEPLISAYRPKSFKDVLGHEEAIRIVRKAIETNSHAHSYLLHGPSGVGKTTLARLIGEEFKADVIEIDAATYNGVDAMRALCNTGRHMSLRNGGIRMFVMNEVQRLSRGAWDALLTILEEPPSHLYFALTTTEFDKIPEAVKTRCFKVQLEPLSTALIEQLLEDVIEKEGWTVNDSVFNKIKVSANGSPRDALAMLQATWMVRDVAEMERIAAIGSEPLKQIFKDLLAGKRGWEPIRKNLVRLTDSDFETGIVWAGRYLAGAMTNSAVHERDLERVKNNPQEVEKLEKAAEKTARDAYHLLDALIIPTTTYDRRIALYTAIGRIIWGGS